MDKELLLKLRKRQYLIMNIIILALFILFFFFFDSPNFNRFFYIILSALIIINIVRYLKKKEITMNFLPFMKPLVEYEKAKLGPEWAKMQKQNFIMQIVLLFLFLPRVFLPPTSVQFTIEEKMTFYIPLLIICLLAVNIIMFFHARKIDQSETGELRGYSMKNLIFGLLFGFILAVVITIIVFILVFSQA